MARSEVGHPLGRPGGPAGQVALLGDGCVEVVGVLVAVGCRVRFPRRFVREAAEAGALELPAELRCGRNENLVAKRACFKPDAFELHVEPQRKGIGSVHQRPETLVGFSM